MSSNTTQPGVNPGYTRLGRGWLYARRSFLTALAIFLVLDLLAGLLLLVAWFEQGPLFDVLLLRRASAFELFCANLLAIPIIPMIGAVAFVVGFARTPR